MSDERLVRCGRISYTNDLPVYAAFDAGALAFPGTLRAGVPTELNRSLLDGSLDISPISSFFYAQHPRELQMLPDVCIGSRREVVSICCISAQPIRRLDGTAVAVTKDSATGRALLDIICRGAHGFAVQYVESDDPLAHYREGGACLLIGDAAIDASLTAPPEHVYDLGLLWHEMTGADMVYAVWAAPAEFIRKHPRDVSKVLSALRGSLSWSADHMGQVVRMAQASHARPPGFYESYYKTLNYSFDDDAWNGLKTFVSLAAALGVLDIESMELRAPAARQVLYHV
ncbi:MAG TPA: menaquinone biosynthesis protein [Candidatus Eremiobacteraceae bacterium]|nr:menaquinone biosynthesis protein [Candidatus Eremiobacteraceae bacterium]